MKIDFVKRHISPKEQEFVLDALQQKFIHNGGKYIDLCCKHLSNIYPQSACCITSTGFNAIYMSLLLIGINAGDEVLLSAYSCTAALNCVMLLGATPILCGVDNTGCITKENIIAATTPHTKAVIVNHHGGYCCEIDEIAAYCKKAGIVLIEDCATAFGSIFKGRRLGSFGEFAIFSFNDKKDLCSGEGGALLINSVEYACRMEPIVNNGLIRKDGVPHWVGVGFSNKVSDIVGAVLYAQLLDSERLIGIKQNITKQYRRGLMPILNHGISYPHEIEGSQPNGNTFYLLFKNEQQKSRLKNYLLEQGVITLSHYGTLDNGKIKLVCVGDTCNGKQFDERMLRLPGYTALTDAEIEFIIEKINYICSTELKG